MQRGSPLALCIVFRRERERPSLEIVIMTVPSWSVIFHDREKDSAFMMRVT